MVGAQHQVDQAAKHYFFQGGQGDIHIRTLFGQAGGCQEFGVLGLDDQIVRLDIGRERVP